MGDGSKKILDTKGFFIIKSVPPEIIVQAINKDFCYFNNNSLVGLDDITYLVMQYGETPVKRLF